MSTVVRWNPIRELAAMQSAFDRVFEDAWRNASPSTLPIDVHETDTAFTVVAAAPGLSPEDIDINLHEGILTIVSEIARPEVAEGTRVLMQENAYGKFTRRLNLNSDIDADNVEAAYENGLLTLTLPKAPSVQPRRIEIKNGKLLNSNN